MDNSTARPRIVVVIAVIAILFGLMTLKAGSSVIFIDGADRVAAGHYVPFVLWFNFLAGFAYITAGVGLYLWQEWAIKLSLLIAGSTLFVFAAFSVHILSGGDYELRTVTAMCLRSAVWLTIGFFTRNMWKKTSEKLDYRNN
jgi:hypothetical protein